MTEEQLPQEIEKSPVKHTEQSLAKKDDKPKRFVEKGRDVIICVEANAFSSQCPIDERYDLKGSMVGRLTRKEDKAKDANVSVTGEISVRKETREGEGKGEGEGEGGREVERICLRPRICELLWLCSSHIFMLTKYNCCE